MSSINLPWESENIVEWSKGQLVVDATSSPVVTTLISSLKNPTQFAIIVTLDEEKPPEAPSAQVGFLAKIKNMASNAASQAVSAKRQMTAGANRLASVYDVKYVIPIACNVEFSITAGSLIVSWAQLPPTRGEPVRREIRINNLSNKFVNVFNATKEISLVKEKVEFGLNGNTTVFNWLWKYQPIQPVPIDPEMPPANLSIAPAQILGRILCLTWNVAGLPPPDDNPMNVLPSSFTKYKTSLVAFLKRHDVEIVILSLQEASPLNAKTVLFKSADDNYGEAWMEWFGDVLNCSGPTNKADWVKTTGIIQVGLAVAMFVKNTDENKVARVTAPMTSCVKTGTLGLTGNKGCVGLRSKVSFPGGPVPLSVSVLNVHLASGEGKCDFRKNELMKVANESSFGEDKSTHFFDSEFCVVTGDLNSRVNDEQIDGGGNEIPADDELLTRMREEGNAFMYNENEIRFPATYKLVPGEEGRLVFHMNRKPGWCDRVLFRSAPLSSTKVRFHCVEYNSLRELDLSDHTPVYAVFALGESLKADHQDAPLRSQPRTTSPSLTTRDEPEFKINDSVEDDDDDDDSDLYDNN